MAKQTGGTTCHDKTVHSKRKRTRHKTVQAKSKARERGENPPRGKGKKQRKDGTNVSGGFHPAKRGPSPDLRPQVFGGGGGN